MEDLRQPSAYKYVPTTTGIPSEPIQPVAEEKVMRKSFTCQTPEELHGMIADLQSQLDKANERWQLLKDWAKENEKYALPTGETRQHFKDLNRYLIGLEKPS